MYDLTAHTADALENIIVVLAPHALTTTDDSVVALLAADRKSVV